MKKIKLKNITASAFVALLAASGYVGVELNSMSAEMAELEFKTARNEIAFKCWKEDGHLTWNELNLLVTLMNAQNEIDGGSKVKKIKGTKVQKLPQYCKAMIHF